MPEGLHLALWFSLSHAGDINVGATWDDDCWDLLTCPDVYAHEQPGGVWHNMLMLSEYRRDHPTIEAAWRTACTGNVGSNGGTLCFQPQAAAALLVGADAVVGNKAGRAHDARSGGSSSPGSGGLSWPARAKISKARPGLERAARAAK